MIFDQLLTAASLAIDALAVSICIGTAFPRSGFGAGVRMGAACGAFQFLMPLIGFFAGGYALPYISSFDHWIAFALLAFVGGNMIRESFCKDDGCAYTSDPTKSRALITIAVATSIDALAVGASFSMAGLTIWPLAIGAGVITAALCFAGSIGGAMIGSKLGSFSKRIETLGGCVLIFIGISILREHLG